MDLYPLKFNPRLVEKIWGGRKLQSVLGRPLPAGVPVGESWEIYDFPPGVVGTPAAGGERPSGGAGASGSADGGWVSAVVANGPLAGRSLHALLADLKADVHGDVPLLPVAGSDVGQFPVLVKYLDAREDLSVQVHPDAAYCRDKPGVHLKTEMWYVVQHDAGSRILKGLKPGVTREQFERAAAAGTVESLINAVAAKDGQCHFLPSGTVHALGAGSLVAEVQTPSDTTFRIHDFGRVDERTGKPRTLHLAEALDCVDFGGELVPEQPRSHVGGIFTTVSRLVTCPYFNVEKVRFAEGVEEPVPYDQPVVWMMLEGQAEVRVNGGLTTPVGRGDTVLLPAAMREPVLKTLSACVWLEVTFPTGRAEIH
jgi:mannose-6-phosphate isomerase